MENLYCNWNEILILIKSERWKLENVRPVLLQQLVGNFIEFCKEPCGKFGGNFADFLDPQNLEREELGPLRFGVWWVSYKSLFLSNSGRFFPTKEGRFSSELWFA